MIKLRDESSFQSVSKKKIMHLDECHDISRQGQDALLKQVEQCPEHLIYLFSTTEPESLKPTLRKRCMQFQVSKVDPDLISKRLKEICDKEAFKYEVEALDAMAWECHGHVRDSINILEEVAFLGDITLENFRKISHNLDSDVCRAIVGLGVNLKDSLDAVGKMSSLISARELYDQTIIMLSDVAKLMYNYDGFTAQRKALLEKIRDVQGSRVLEFMDYLLHRDKHIDRIGLQSDFVLLHYKFSANNFQPKSEFRPDIKASPTTEMTHSQNLQPEGIPQPSAPKISQAQFSKMSMKDKGRVLREQRLSKEEKPEEEKLRPSDWPLPKEERVGVSSFDDEELTPQEFSHLLVGGHGHGSS